MVNALTTDTRREFSTIAELMALIPAYPKGTTIGALDTHLVAVVTEPFVHMRVVGVLDAPIIMPRAAKKPGA